MKVGKLTFYILFFNLTQKSLLRSNNRPFYTPSSKINFIGQFFDIENSSGAKGVFCGFTPYRLRVMAVEIWLYEGLKHLPRVGLTHQNTLETIRGCLV